MENTINTIKYTETIKNIFIMATFLISSPIITFAQYDLYGSNPEVTNLDFGTNNSSTNFNAGTLENQLTQIYGSNPGVTNLDFGTDTSVDDWNWDFDDYDFIADPDVYTVNYTNQTSYGSNDYYRGYGGYYPSSYYGYGTSYGMVHSGGYIAGANTYTAPSTYTVAAPSVVTSGGYIPGSSTYTDPSNYYVSDTTTVYSGSGYMPAVSSIPSSNYSDLGLTSEIIPNQVLAYTDTNSNLDSIYLSDIPSTGFDDYYRTTLFILTLVVWSVILAYIFLIRKVQLQTVGICSLDKNESSNTGNIINSNLLEKINFDNSDINKVEEYARMKKVLLSSDALIKIVKLSRLGQINASEYIRSISTGEWIAIGEDKIV